VRLGLTLIVYDLSRPDLIPPGPHSDCFLVDDEAHCFPDSFDSYAQFQRHLQAQERRSDTRRGPD
jgi:hypothetical protein